MAKGAGGTRGGIRTDRVVVLCSSSLAILCAACGGQSHPPGDAGIDSGPTCVDPDQDGWGAGVGCLGEDCREDDPALHECDCGPDGLAHAAGCPCDAIQPEVCYEGTAGTAEIGGCTFGFRRCADGRWSTCEGQVVDSPEVCNGSDDDCDGEVDERLLNECGDCYERMCEFVEYGPAGTPFEPAQGTGVGTTDEGFLTLGESERPHLVWIPNSIDGTISKFDSRTREEVGRYRTGPNGVSAGLWSGDGDNPSRTGVNRHGDVTVANRAFTRVASATKILADDCPTNGDGEVDTSSGGDDVREWGEDDCVAWSTQVGEEGQLGRALAVHERAELDGASHEYAWIGLYLASRYHEIDGETGELTGVEASTRGCTPYGAAVDADGILWSACLGSMIARFDTDDPDDFRIISLPEGETGYGIDVDLAGNVWTGMAKLFRYRPAGPADDQWDTIETRTSTSGIVDDASGIVWAHGDTGAVVRIDTNDPDLPFEIIETGGGGRGVAIDADGFVWVINWMRGGMSDGYVTILDPGDYTSVDTTCCESISNSYAYADMTGEPRLAGHGDLGSWQVVVPGCERPAEVVRWDRVFFEGDFPDGSSLRLEARGAASVPELPGAPWVELGVHPPDESPFAIGPLIEDEVLELRATLEGDPPPIVRRIAVQLTCVTF